MGRNETGTSKTVTLTVTLTLTLTLTLTDEYSPGWRLSELHGQCHAPALPLSPAGSLQRCLEFRTHILTHDYR